MDNFVDNQGIRSGLEKVTLQLVETNKKLDEQNKPNLVKAFQENQAEVFATYFTAKQQMQQQEVIASSVVSGVGTVKTPKTAGGQQTSNLPSEDDTLYGLMFKLLQVTIEKNEADAIEKAARQETAQETLRGLTEGQRTLKRTIQKQIDDLEASNVEWGTMGAEKTEERIYSLEKKLDDLKDIQRNNLKEAIAARKERQKERKKEEDFKKAQFSFSTQFKKGLFGVSDSLSAKGTFGSLLKDKLMGLGGVFKKGIGKLGFGLGKLALGIVSIGSKIMGGFKALGKKFGELFMKFLGGIGFALKTIGAVLLIGGLYKFLSSETWQKMKPKIAESIGNGLAIMDKALDKLIEAIPVVVDGLKTMASGLMTAIEFIAELTGFKGKNVRSEIEEQVRIDLRGHDESVIQKEVDKRVRLARKKEIERLGKIVDRRVKEGKMSIEGADKFFAEQLRKFDADTYGSYILNDKLKLSKADLERHEKMVATQQSNFTMANQNNQYNSNPTYTRYIQNMTNKNGHSSSSSDQK